MQQKIQFSLYIYIIKRALSLKWNFLKVLFEKFPYSSKLILSQYTQRDLQHLICHLSTLFLKNPSYFSLAFSNLRKLSGFISPNPTETLEQHAEP